MKVLRMLFGMPFYTQATQTSTLCYRGIQEQGEGYVGFSSILEHVLRSSRWTYIVLDWVEGESSVPDFAWYTLACLPYSWVTLILNLG